MRGWAETRTRWALAAVAAVLMGVSVGALAAVRTVAPRDVRVIGDLVYTWSGSAGSGCSAVGVCDVSGSVVVEFAGRGKLEGGAVKSAQLFPSSVTVRGLRESGWCIDRLQTYSDVELQIVPARRGGYRARIDAPGISAGRCAGPLAADLAHASLRVSRSETVGFDLRGSRPFTAGPYSGTMVSSLQLRGGNASAGSRGGTFSTSTTSASVPPPTRRAWLEYANVRLRITGARSALGVRFAGSGGPGCEPVDSCGTTGRLRLAVQGLSRTFTLSAQRTVRHAIGRAGALADLRAGRLQFDLFGGLDARFPARISETLARDGQPSCQERVLTPMALLLAGAGFRDEGRAISGTLSTPDGFTDALRTHCPGPASADVVAGLNLPGPSDSEQPIAGGEIPLRDLGRRHLELILSGPGLFAGDGYDGARGGALSFSLSLISIRAGSDQVPVG